MSVSKSLRYQVLRRDGFRCVYCGRGAADSPLEIDHVIPRSNGGVDTLENLTTACRDCNAGKGATGARHPDPRYAVRVRDMGAEQLRAALLAALTGPMGCFLTWCQVCGEFCTIGPGCDPPCCYHLHAAAKVVP